MHEADIEYKWFVNVGSDHTALAYCTYGNAMVTEMNGTAYMQSQ